MNNEKTCLRTCLTNEILDDILRININGTDFKDFDAKPHVQLWLDTKGTRHIKGHSGPKRKAENEDSIARKLKCLVLYLAFIYLIVVISAM